MAWMFTLEQLCYKVKEEEIITASAKAASDKAATWAAKCAEQKQKHPSRAFWLLGIRRATSSSCNSKRTSNLNLKSVSVLLVLPS